jgi:membrane fusion protein, multidrug efflux system
MEQKPPGTPVPPDHQLPSSVEAPPPPKKKSRQWLWILLLLGFALIFVLVLRHHDDSEKQAGGGKQGGGGRGHGFQGPVTLTTTTAKKGDIGVYLDAIGTVTPVYTTTLYNQVTGVITKVYYREGQSVRKGDPLVEIDPRQYAAQVDVAAGTLERDQGVLAQAQMDLERYQAAWAKNAIPKQTLDDQEKLVLQDQGLVKSDQGTLDYDKVQLSYTHIVSPINGKVGLRLVDPGNLVQSSGSTALAVVTQMNPITVVFTIAQDHLSDIISHMRGTALTVDAYDRSQEKKLSTGKLLALDNQVDTTTGTIKLRAQFDNSKEVLYPNEFVNTRLLVETQHNMTLIPSNIVQHNGDVAFVYVIKDGVAKMQKVTEGTTDAGQTAVEGVEPGDVLASSSYEKLQDGSKVVLSKKPVPKSTSESDAP